MTSLSLQEVASALPATLRASATQSLVDKINAIVSDPLEAEYVRDNFISYTAVLKDGKFKADDYLSAVTYVSLKLMGNTNQDAWCKTFPDRYALLVGRGATSKEISAHVSAYNKGKLVNIILEQTLVPTWVLNQAIYQQAINTQVELMRTANSEKVRSDAANSLLTHLKKPEGKDFQISLVQEDNTGMKELKSAIETLATTQQQMIQNGIGIKNITQSRIIEGEKI